MNSGHFQPGTFLKYKFPFINHADSSRITVQEEELFLLHYIEWGEKKLFMHQEEKIFFLQLPEKVSVETPINFVLKGASQEIGKTVKQGLCSDIMSHERRGWIKL